MLLPVYLSTTAFPKGQVPWVKGPSFCDSQKFEVVFSFLWNKIEFLEKHHTLKELALKKQNSNIFQ